MMKLVCTRISVYSGALTRGRVYDAVATDPEKRQFRVVGDNGRTRWFPAFCFDMPPVLVPILLDFKMEDGSDVSSAHAIEVTVRLSNGQERWCIFATPSFLAAHGDCVPGTEVRYHAGNAHVIVSSEVTSSAVGQILRLIDNQGRLEECTLPLVVTSAIDEQATLQGTSVL